MMSDTASHLSDERLIARLKSLAGSERGVTVRLIVHLAEFDARRLYLGLGFPSLFVYCRSILLLSEQAAYHRIVGARAARRFPSVIDRLEEGSLNLSTLRIIAPHLTRDNHADLLGAALGKSKREVEELVACRFPEPIRPAFVRKVSIPNSTSGSKAQGTEDGQASSLPTVTPAVISADVSDRPIAPRPLTKPVPVAPRAEDLYEFRFNGNTLTRDNLKLAQDLLRHAVPDGCIDEIMDRALVALVEKLARRKFAASGRPRAGRDLVDGSRTIPAAVARVVWARDDGRGAFIAQHGRRCESTAFVEFHHVEPHGVGGLPSIENVSLRCRAHNRYEAETFYGRRRQDDGAGVAREQRRPYGRTGPGASCGRRVPRPAPTAL